MCCALEIKAGTEQAQQAAPQRLRPPSAALAQPRGEGLPMQGAKDCPLPAACRTYAEPYISEHIGDLTAWVAIAPVGLQAWVEGGRLPSEEARKQVGGRGMGP